MAHHCIMAVWHHRHEDAMFGQLGEACTWLAGAQQCSAVQFTATVLHRVDAAAAADLQQ